jgi:hypothetical protein
VVREGRFAKVEQVIYTLFDADLNAELKAQFAWFAKLRLYEMKNIYFSSCDYVKLRTKLEGVRKQINKCMKKLNNEIEQSLYGFFDPIDPNIEGMMGTNVIFIGNQQLIFYSELLAELTNGLFCVQRLSILYIYSQYFRRSGRYEGCLKILRFLVKEINEWRNENELNSILFD